ncbi:winged helix-turn-helix domain-containing protein [Nocardiopsis tropica]|jgi:DNA-binding transcriptional regulator YhcF (GntR family)|uniref:Winged helix-turn-helix domain-containing protein n=1 Tax=Nocardiopsis tropica TaxID=109330 RepID=A0ABU7L1N5_9ACTN|nr:winged helix-turn-helix domain-containing protein [Nocardiopsis umidischolae]MEE2055480.1 winged helix-turn-helix domain-containing protein [Nocardiopsis umidischolae]
MSSISLLTKLSRPAAPYAQIAAHYRELIEAGGLQPGDRLPTITEMATAWRVSPGTAHKAIRRLRGEGLVHTTRQGTTVERGAA